MKNKVFLSSPHMSKEGYELEYINDAFKKNWIAPLGENVNEFENEMSNFIGSKYAAALSAGTAAIHLALKSVGVESDDIVFCQDLTFSATVNPIIYQNAKPVFIDSDNETWNMDPKALRKAFKKYPNPKCVLVVHLYGDPASMDEIVNICKENNTLLIEDAAESLGSKYRNKYTGTFGKVGIYSFNGNKIITTSGGGMLVSEDEKLVEKVRFWATQSRDKARYYQHTELGYNYRMSNIVAGIGRGQLKILNDRITKKREIYDFYKEKLKNIKEINIKEEPINSFSNHWLSVISINSKCKIRPLDIIEALEKENIEARHVWKPMHMQPFFEKYDFITLEDQISISESLFEKGVCLPSDTKMTKEEQEGVINIIIKLFK